MIFPVCKDLPLTLCMGKQFEEYFSIIEYDEHDNELFNRVLEVRVDPKDKEKILEAKEREKEKLEKPPQCMKKRTKAGDTKRRKKGDTDSIFGK